MASTWTIAKVGILLVAVAFTLTWIFCCQFGFTQQFPFDAVGPVLQVVQTIALDSGLLHGPANTILAAQRAVEAGALALNVDVVLAQGDRLVAAHNATHWLPMGGFPTFSCGSLSSCQLKDLERELSPSCQYFKHFYLLSGVPAESLETLKPCGPQPLNFVEEFLEHFPEMPITFDLKAETTLEQRRLIASLHQMLTASYPHRPKNLTTLRLFVPSEMVSEALNAGPWDWSRFRLAVGIPMGRAVQNDAMKVLPRLPKVAIDELAAVYVGPEQLQETRRIPAHLRRQSAKLPWVCDLGLQEAESEFLPLHQMMEECLHHGVSVIHTGRVGAVANFLNSTKFNQSSQKESPELSRGKPSMTIISQRNSEDSIHLWSSSGQLDTGSVWTRCAGKLATALLVQRLVELRLLPGLDEPIVEFLQLSGKHFPTWKEHPVMKNLTLRHVMAGVGGLPKWRWLPDWVTQKVRSALELAERSLSFVNSSFPLGQRFIYSNMQWAVVELAVQRATSLDWPTAAQKFLFHPLGLSENTYYRSEDKPACHQTRHSSIFEERNLRAGIGLCSTAEDLFLLGITLRRLCKHCFLSEAGMREVAMDQLATNFPSAVKSFLNRAPATDFAANGLALAGRGFAGYHLSGGWLLAHGGAEGYLGQNVLVQTEQNGSTSHNSQVLTTFISTVEMPKDMVALAKDTLSSFMESHGAPKVTSVEASSTSTPSDHDQKSVSGWQPCNEVEHRIPPHDCHLPFPNVFHNKVLGAMAETLYACRGFAFQHREMNKMNDQVVQPKQCGATFQSFRSGPELEASCAAKTEITTRSEVTEITDHVKKCLSKISQNQSSRQQCSMMSSCASAWNLVSRLGDSRQFSKVLPDIIWRLQKLLIASPQKEDIAGLPTCLRYPLDRARLCGGMKPYHAQVKYLEQMYPDLRNMWYHEHQALIDFTPYVPLPATGVVIDTHLKAKKGKTILIVAGANKFCRAPKYLMEMYSPYFSFDKIFLFDGHEIDGLPENVTEAKISVQTRWMSIATRDESDLIALLPSMVREEDFVVLMWDTDLAAAEETLEWGFMADLLSQTHSLVDELFVEMHFTYPRINWIYDQHVPREAFELLSQLRHTCGFAVHAWP